MGFLIIILMFIEGIGLVNEKWLHLQSDIARVFFSLIIGVVLLLVSRLLPGRGSLNCSGSSAALNLRPIFWIPCSALCCLREPARSISVNSGRI